MCSIKDELIKRQDNIDDRDYGYEEEQKKEIKDLKNALTLLTIFYLAMTLAFILEVVK